ncbi:PhzF family phenazine biosynthesis protein [Flavobacteriaceae bacterium M23B6Z8]
MEIPIYQTDNFAKALFKGNPAAVCVLPFWLPDATLKNIAQENNLAETAFLVRNGVDYDLRWFMPYDEIDLCGHATLAAAYVVFNELDPPLKSICFLSKSGRLTASQNKDKSITLDFPSRPPEKIDIPNEISEGLNVNVIETFAHRDLIIRVASENEVRKAAPSLESWMSLPYLAYAITAPGDNADFVSRVFDPHGDIPEDPVTGSTHASLTPYWADILKKNTFNARQLSERGGEIVCQLEEDRVFLSGHVVPYLKGVITL